MFQVERLELKATGQPSVRRAVVGRIWRKIGRPVKRLAVAERIQKGAMVDNPSFTRIRHLASDRPTPRLAAR